MLLSENQVMALMWSLVPLVINARIDSLFPTSPLTENQKRADAISRAGAYWSAGADCVFPPGAGADDLRAIVAEVGAPVNAGLRPTGQVTVTRWITENKDSLGRRCANEIDLTSAETASRGETPR